MTKSEETAAIYDQQAEEYIIASLILDPDLLREVKLTTTDFYLDEPRQLFETIILLWQSGEEINRRSVIRQTDAHIQPWLVDKMLAEAPSKDDCLYYANIVKNLSQRRHIAVILQKGLKDIRESGKSAQEAIDNLRLSLEYFTTEGSSRLVQFSNIRIRSTQPPSYRMTVSSINSHHSDIAFDTEELSSSNKFKRKIREYLQVNPLLPQNFDSFVHHLLQNAQVDATPADASIDQTICYWICEWFRTGTEAEHPDDLSHGYLNREGAYWFPSERVINYVSERAKVKVNSSSLWSVISDRGGRRSKLLSISGKKVRLWGLDHSFFEEQEPADQEQLKMDDDDLSWLEEN